MNPMIPTGRLKPDYFLMDEEDGTHMYLLVRNTQGVPVACEFYGTVDSRPGWVAAGAAPMPPANIPAETLSQWMSEGKKNVPKSPSWGRKKRT